MNTSDNLMTTKDLAAFLGLKPGTIMKRRSKQPGTLPPCIRVGKAVRYEPSSVMAWLATCRVKLV